MTKFVYMYSVPYFISSYTFQRIDVTNTVLLCSTFLYNVVHICFSL